MDGWKLVCPLIDDEGYVLKTRNYYNETIIYYEEVAR